MKIAIHLSHPSQYYVFKSVVGALPRRHDVAVLYNRKDILELLVSREPFGSRQVRIETPRTRSSLLSAGLEFLRKERAVWKALRRERPDLILGTSIFAAHAGWVLRIPTILLTDDDASVIPLTARLAYPLCAALVAPCGCDTGQWHSKTIKYNGYQKLAYLHPARFTPDPAVVQDVTRGQPYALLRFVALDAHHDVSVRGISDEVAHRLIRLLECHGKVLISAERPLTSTLERYRLALDPLVIHHFLAYARLFVSDSQSMSVEAAMLGTPSVRFSGFAGRIGVLEELEHKYHLTRGIPASDPERLIDTVRELIAIRSLREVAANNRMQMLGGSTDVAGFIAEVVDGFPKTIQMCGNTAVSLPRDSVTSL